MEAAEESQLTALRRMAKRMGQARAALPAALPLAAGLALRLWMLKSLFQVNGDTLIYGDLAKNLLLHGSFALTPPNGEMYSTLIRLPGYPLFLAACFRVFGMENYFAAACVQIGLELLGCLLLADFVRRIAPPKASRGAALSTLWLAALCPFTASYTAAPLTETPTLFVLALAMWAMARFRERPGWANALWFTFAVTWAAFLRPDGALAAVAFAPALVIGLPRGVIAPRKLMRMTVVCVLLALAPFAVWTARNWSVFQVFQPLAPRLANDPDERPDLGLERWVKTWCLDFVSTNDIYWNAPGNKLDMSDLPSRAFDSPAQYAETAAIIADYNSHGMEITPEIDARFDKLARERIAAHPLRYYVGLPLGRVADMWLRPRVENLNIDPDWWVYANHHTETEFSWAYVALNALYLLLGFGGLCIPPQRRRPVVGDPGSQPRFERNPGNSAHSEEVQGGFYFHPCDEDLSQGTPEMKKPRDGRASGHTRSDSAVWGALLAYMLLRSALLLAVSAPEARYTLECFPMLFAAGGIALWKLASRLYLPASKLKAPLGNG
jgi:hypothetical protein